MKAIETHWKGYRFRSRLEARWAVYFEALGCDWDYEVQGFDLGDGIRYLPDFLVGWRKGSEAQMLWAEVKPDNPTPEELQKVLRLTTHTRRACILLVGVPDLIGYRLILPEENTTPALLGRAACRETDIVLGQHKGCGRFYLCRGHLGPLDRDEIAYWDDIPQAVRAARSARFEHGESPPRRPPPPPVPEPSAPDPAARVRAGSVVRHGHYGIGTVLSVTGRGALCRAVVRFDTAGQKTFVESKAIWEIVRF